MTPVLIDLLLLAVLAFCVFQGYRKGLILTVGGVLIIFISAIFAAKAADNYAQPLTDSLYPIMSWVADDAYDAASQGKGRPSEITDQRTMTEVAEAAFEILGIHTSESDKMVDMVLGAVPETRLQEAIAATLLYSIAYMLVCNLAFVIIMVALTLLLHFIATIVKLPLLHRLDKIAGTAIGLLYGLMILCIIGWGSRFLGILIDPEIVQKTVFLEFFVNFNFLAGILGF